MQLELLSQSQGQTLKANTATGHRSSAALAVGTDGHRLTHHDPPLINGSATPVDQTSCTAIQNESKHENPLLIVVNIDIMSTV